MTTGERNNEGRSREKDGSQESRRWVNLLVSGLMSLVLIAGISTVLVLPLLSRGVNLQAGEVSPRTIRAPHQITYESPIRTDRARQQAANAVKRVYDPADPKITQQQIRRAANVLDYIDSIRHDPYATLEQKTSWINQAPELQLPAAVVSDTMALDDLSWQVVSSHTLAVLSEVLRQPIREGLDVIDARRRIPNAVDPALPEAQATIVSALASGFVKPNSFYNEERTNASRADASGSVEAQTHSYEKDEVIVREGERVTPEQLEAVQKMGLLREQVRWDDIGGVVLLVVVIVLVTGLYLRRITHDLWSDRRRLDPAGGGHPGVCRRCGAYGSGVHSAGLSVPGGRGRHVAFGSRRTPFCSCSDLAVEYRGRVPGRRQSGTDSLCSRWRHRGRSIHLAD